MKTSKTEFLEMMVKAMLKLLDDMQNMLEEMLSTIRTPDGD